MEVARQSVVVFAKEKARLSAFSLQTLGLTTVESEPSHDVLGGPGIEIIVHAIPEEYAAGIAISSPPQRREDAAFKPAFGVADLETVRRAAMATGGFLEPMEFAWRPARPCHVQPSHRPQSPSPLSSLRRRPARRPSSIPRPWPRFDPSTSLISTPFARKRWRSATRSPRPPTYGDRRPPPGASATH